MAQEERLSESLRRLREGVISVSQAHGLSPDEVLRRIGNDDKVTLDSHEHLTKPELETRKLAILYRLHSLIPCERNTFKPWSSLIEQVLDILGKEATPELEVKINRTVHHFLQYYSRFVKSENIRGVRGSQIAVYRPEWGRKTEDIDENLFDQQLKLIRSMEPEKFKEETKWVFGFQNE